MLKKMLKMNNLKFPIELDEILVNENIDFSVLGLRTQTPKYSIIIISIVLPVAVSFGYVFFTSLPIFYKRHFNLLVNAELKPNSSSDRLTENGLYLAVILMFLIVSCIILYKKVIPYFTKEGYFIGTDCRLIKYKNGILKYYDWEQFTGKVENANNEKDLFLELRRGHFVSRKNSSDEFIPEYVFIASDTNILEIQKICKQRIEENNPSI